MGIMSRRQLVYFVWMVPIINKHRTIDLYDINSQQEYFFVLQSMRCYYLYIIYILFLHYLYINCMLFRYYLDIMFT